MIGRQNKSPLGSVERANWRLHYHLPDIELTGAVSGDCIVAMSDDRCHHRDKSFPENQSVARWAPALNRSLRIEPLRLPARDDAPSQLVCHHRMDVASRATLRRVRRARLGAGL